VWPLLARGGDDGPMADQVIERRRRVAALVSTGKRIGYSLWAISIVLFFTLFFTDFDGPLVPIVVGTLLGGCALLLPAIVLGYAVRAAKREDAEAGRLP